jgi:hypothetical protein
MDFGALPPEINSGRMYTGPGRGSMLAASAAWDGLAADLHFTAASYQSVISDLTGAAWLGPPLRGVEDIGHAVVAAGFQQQHADVGLLGQPP